MYDLKRIRTKERQPEQKFSRSQRNELHFFNLFNGVTIPIDHPDASSSEGSERRQALALISFNSKENVEHPILRLCNLRTFNNTSTAESDPHEVQFDIPSPWLRSIAGRCAEMRSETRIGDVRDGGRYGAHITVDANHGELHGRVISDERRWKGYVHLMVQIFSLPIFNFLNAFVDSSRRRVERQLVSFPSEIAYAHRRRPHVPQKTL
jgi:hypothetical protein